MCSNTLILSLLLATGRSPSAFCDQFIVPPRNTRRIGRGDGYDGAVIRTAYLRVYQPIDSFSEQEKKRWMAYSEDGDDATSGGLRSWLVSASLPSSGLAGQLTEGCFVRRIDEKVFVCPWRTRLRMLAGLLAFRGSVPEEVADVFVPRDQAERAAHELAAMGETDPEIKSHILHANWHVPLRWFAAFDPSERVLIEDRRGLRVRYEAALADGQRRLARALEILEASAIDSAVVEAVRELSEWLEEFPGEGIVELDYGGVSAAFAEDDLVNDQSAAEVWTCLQALATGDLQRAAETFEALSERWTEIRSFEVVN